MRKIGQVRFYSSGNAKNQPSQLRTSQLISGSVFSTIGNGGRIVQLGIQTLPGVKFYINKGAHPLVVGNTGVYDLELDNNTTITSLSFDATSINLIDNNENSYLIVDYIYEEG